MSQLLRRTILSILLCMLLVGNAVAVRAAGTGTAATEQNGEPKKPKEITAVASISLETESIVLRATFPEDAFSVKVALYSLLGKPIEIQQDATVGKGEATFRFDTRGLPNGPYIIVLEGNGQRLSKKVMLSR